MFNFSPTPFLTDSDQNLKDFGKLIKYVSKFDYIMLAQKVSTNKQLNLIESEGSKYTQNVAGTVKVQSNLVCRLNVKS